MIPICVISHNNGKYVQNMVTQLCRINPAFASSIRIIDNCSTDPETLAYLRSAPVRVIWNGTNEGPWITPTKNKGIYAMLPDLFVLTDPDLELNPRLPPNFLDQMVEIAQLYRTSKLGFALDISEPWLLLEGEYIPGYTIAEQESQFWRTRIPNATYELYYAGLDTTFCLVNKEIPDHPSRHLRIAGDFTAKHLPWYKKNPLYTPAEIAALVKEQSPISTTSKLIRWNLERGLLS